MIYLNIINKYNILISMMDLVYKNTEEINQEISKKIKNENCGFSEDSITEKIESGEISIESNSKWMELNKNLKRFLKSEYRRICKSTHPDVSDSSISKKFFITAREAFDEENIFEIMRVSSIVLDTKDFKISKQDAFDMEKYLNMRIKKIKNNSAFFWSEMTEEEKSEEVSRTIRSIKKII